MASDGRFTDAEHRQILDAIGAAERLTSGEIRLFVEDVCGENVLDRAAYIFHELKMDRTAERNGVL
ncbi:MAG TPA: TPM domain-containing protein, partial [Bacteroidia bacterium]|nr:TPM domain-containing protein [Bacteroidia bacterium]